jgi:hypothetical protein
LVRDECRIGRLLPEFGQRTAKFIIHRDIESSQGELRQSRQHEAGTTDDEEARIRRLIAERCLQNLPAFEFALNTGLRAGEQFNLRLE